MVIDNFLNDSLYIRIRDFFFARLQEFEPAGIGAQERHQIVTSIRGDSTYWLDSKHDHELESFWGLVRETVQMLNRYCYLSLSGFEFHLAHYPAGSYYKRHLDQFQGRNNRLISMIIYLNEGWQKGDGGELELIASRQSPQLVEPIAKRCVLFKSADVPHAVLKANKSRYSLTGWLLYRPAALGSLLT